MSAFKVRLAIASSLAAGLTLASVALAAPRIGVPAPLSGKAESANFLVVALTWTNIDGETGYVIERKLATSAAFAEIAKLPTDQTTYKDNTTASAAYQYRVRAYRVWKGRMLYSDYTNPVTVSTTAPAPVPTSPAPPTPPADPSCPA
jgi:hypothetical protein